MVRIINADTRQSDMGFFLQYTVSQDIGSGEFQVETPVSYTTSADTSSFSVSYDKSFYLSGYGAFDGDEGSYSLCEYYKPGLGPIGYAEYEYVKHISGSTTYWNSSSWKLWLLDTSLQAEGSFVIPSSPWRVYADMPGTTRGAKVAEVDGTIYLFGGMDGDSVYTQETYRLNQDRTWTACSPFPEYSQFVGAGVRYPQSSNEVYLTVSMLDSWIYGIYQYNHEADDFYPVITFEPSSYESFWDGILYKDTYLMMVYTSRLVPYDLESEEFGATIYLDDELQYTSAVADGDRIYLVGYTQYRMLWYLPFEYTTWVRYFDGTSWSDPVWVEAKECEKPAVVIHNRRLYIFGGTDEGTQVLSFSIEEGVPTDRQVHSPMLYGGSSLQAVARGDKILVFGCDSGRKVEEYTPGNDLP